MKTGRKGLHVITVGSETLAYSIVDSLKGFWFFKFEVLKREYGGYYGGYVDYEITAASEARPSKLTPRGPSPSPEDIKWMHLYAKGYSDCWCRWPVRIPKLVKCGK